MKFDRLIDAMAPVRKGPFGVSKGGLILEDHLFEKCVFNTVQNPAPKGQKFILRRVEFDRCVTETGPFWLSHGWVLEDVHINKMKAWRIMLSAKTELRRVKISSYAKAGRLEILPGTDTEHLDNRQLDIEGYGLDVSEFKGDLRIFGVNASAVTVDPTRQFRLRLPDATIRSSDIEGLEPASLLAITVDQMNSWRVRDAVCALPPPKDKYLDQEKLALSVALKAGIAF